MRLATARTGATTVRTSTADTAMEASFAASGEPWSRIRKYMGVLQIEAPVSSPAIIPKWEAAPLHTNERFTTWM